MLVLGFLRIVGRAPKEDLQEIPIQRIDLPNNLQEILEKILPHQPVIFCQYA
ncbi:hypothetical protein P4S73_10155 [Paraglaciecola sp. Hal342]